MHYPTTEQLALIAATLARQSNAGASELVESAFTLWRESARKINKEREIQRQHEANTSRPLWPQPDNFPTNHEKMVGVLVPKLKGRTADVAAVLRRYMNNYAQNRLVPIQQRSYQTAAGQFMRWYEEQKKESISKARSEAGKRGGRNQKKKDS